MDRVKTIKEAQKRIINLEITQEIIVNALVKKGILKIGRKS